MTQPVRQARKALSLHQLRTLILVALVIGVTVFTGIVVTLVHSLSERFGPQVEADLEWRALRGASELARTADLGLAVSDRAMVQESFGAYVGSSDVQAIVAMDAHGQVVASHGTAPEISDVFAAKPGTLVHGERYVASWAPAVIEGDQVGKIAVIVSTRRLHDAQATLSWVSHTTLIAGIVGGLLGMIVILYFTRAVSIRDSQLKDYAHNLERKVDERTRELDDRNRGMRLVLDNVAQGFVTIDLDGAMASERSAIVDRWFGVRPAGVKLAEVIADTDPNLAEWFTMNLESLREGHLPPELSIAQMPTRFARGGATYEIGYSPLVRDQQIEGLLVIISDITDQLGRDRIEREQRELVTMFQRITSDRAGFDEFMEDTQTLVGSLAKPADPVVERRTIHTLKGNCAIYGLAGFAAVCHALETELEDSVSPLDDAQRVQLIDGWAAVTARLAHLLEGRRHVVEVEFPELARAVELAKQDGASRELRAMLTAWTHDRLARRFERLASHATSLARRLGKGELATVIADNNIRLDTSRWMPFWSAMIHAVRNAVDHGIEPTAVRAELDKPAQPTLTFTATRTGGRLVISLSDDGAGINWTAVRERAIQRGLPASSAIDLERALFADGFSTAEQVTETSGRGVGMAALREAVTALGGEIELDSRSGLGTTLRFVFPEAAAGILPLRATLPPPMSGVAHAAPA
jgi:two-component system chemotaxis sensor kinase CheA